MRLAMIATVALLQTTWVSSATAQLPPVDEPFEPELAVAPSPPAERRPSLLVDFATFAIQGYQHSHRDVSIARCPYAVSCSRFALESIQTHGFALGTLLFVDRFFYRENTSARERYRLVRQGGRLLLDDSLP